ncbi:protein VASCULATURE COMPLEXITY AND CONNECTIVITY-like [Lycium barbarum]|uniref:protein VASCULATURE COMPLEXITY AND CONNECTIVITY-like n=1 Tax=Lycium barbarum TaxID=112863 RepID=UPI00293EB0BC|nr:protein VASCULATURE COMPLEXITY AND CONNECTIVITY-like [Lycium barbarum]
MGKLVKILGGLLIVALDIVAGILGYKAEAAQDQEKHLTLWMLESCSKPSHEAFVFGLAAATLLGVAHVLANLLGGCSVCSTDDIRKATPIKQLSIACLVFTWIIFAVGLGTLVIGTNANHKSTTSCVYLHHNYLSIGGVLSFVHALFSVGYYVTASQNLA